ncbi:MAG: hypothetical protein LPK07_04740 [Hymenobacteraceae bacterium]|nr:hypothetical protein [Hymenobacteraceae bacterium]MDX5480968.1 hypothetical protein [Hymenobacteraceae bacterium]
MRYSAKDYKTLLTIYICLLLGLGSFFLMQDPKVLVRMQEKLPLIFLMRFAAFWFISMVLALILFLVHVRLNDIYLSDSEIALSAKVGKFVFAAGAATALVCICVFYTLLY